MQATIRKAIPNLKEDERISDDIYPASVWKKDHSITLTSTSHNALSPKLIIKMYQYLSCLGK